MLSPEEIKRRLKDSNLSAVAKNADVKYTMLSNFMRGTDPKFYLVEKLSDYLTKKENGEVCSSERSK